jgi:hypothetical protein
VRAVIDPQDADAYESTVNESAADNRVSATNTFDNLRQLGGEQLAHMLTTKASGYCGALRIGRGQAEAVGGKR